MTYQEQADQIAILLKQKLGARGPDLKTRLRRAGRLLPGYIRRDVEILVQAAQMQDSPKMSRIVDGTEVQRAFDVSQSFLRSVDVRKRKMDRIVGLVATNAFSLLVIGSLVLVVIHWRKLI